MRPGQGHTVFCLSTLPNGDEDGVPMLGAGQEKDYSPPDQLRFPGQIY